MSMSTTRRARSGAAATEVALTMPVFVLLLVGVLEYGWVMPGGTTLEHVARDAARAGALVEDPADRVAAATTRASARLAETIFDPSDVATAVQAVTLPSTGDAAVEVTLTAQYRALFGLVPTPLTLTGSAVVRAEVQP